jgi:anti-sigma regulatory factor (Ser/Thr protein kinase)
VVAVGSATEAAHDFSKSAELASDDAARVCILVEELVANVLEHGGSPFADIALALDGRYVSIAVADAGTCFNPAAVQESQHEAERGGGAGLALVRAWAEIVSYESRTGINRLHLLLPLRG